MIILLMGVTASGKSTVGKRLALELGWKFLEGDDFHPPENIEKLRQGEPLNNEDRKPWLEAIRGAIGAAMDSGRRGCSNPSSRCYHDCYSVRTDIWRYPTSLLLCVSIPIVTPLVPRKTHDFPSPSPSTPWAQKMAPTQSSTVFCLVPMDLRCPPLASSPAHRAPATHARQARHGPRLRG